LKICLFYFLRLNLCSFQHKLDDLTPQQENKKENDFQISLLVDLVIARSTDPNADSSVVLKWADRMSLGQIVSELLEVQTKENPANPLDFVFNWAIDKDCVQLLKLLLADKRIDPSGNDQYAIRWASQTGQAEIVKLLLTDQRVDPSAGDQYSIRMASYHGYAEVVKLLLTDKRVNPSVDEHYCLRYASWYGRTEVVKLLLADERVDPSADNQAAICLSAGGHIGVVKLLLADKRVDPSADGQASIRFACTFGQSDVVKLLLSDKRVDPSANNQASLRQASENGHAEVIKLLLADKRVDPSAKDQYSIRLACQGGHADAVKVLLADQRVDISGLPVPSFPEILALVSLRRSFRCSLLEGKQQHQDQPDVLSVVADIEKIESRRKTLLDEYLLSDLSDLCLSYVPDLFCHLDSKISSLVDPNSGSKFPRFSFDNLSSL
jgi:ankyrin repeat protein